MDTINQTIKLISIPAPRMGSDIGDEITDEMESNFNPRSPHGERRRFTGSENNCIRISIPAPRMGSDLKRAESRLLQV